MTSDIALSGVACTSGVTPRQLVQSSSENDILRDELVRPTNDHFLTKEPTLPISQQDTERCQRQGLGIGRFSTSSFTPWRSAL